MVADPPKPSGRKQQKTRTGCYTCKTRRVKCDESKPFCFRCMRFGVDCDGYPPIIAKGRQTKTLLPRSEVQNETKNPPKLALSAIHTGPRFESALEERCFRLYFENMAGQIQGPFKTSFWDRLIPQTSEKDVYIRDAIVAIGALSTISNEAKKNTPSPTESNQTADYQFALMKFGKALRGMQIAIADGKSDVRKAMIMCILIFCFQTLIGKPAIDNAQSGMMLLHKWIQSQKGQHTAFLLGTEWREQKIEEEIMAAFGSLDLQILFFLDTRPDTVHQTMIEHSNKMLSTMPDEFPNLESAKSFWALLMRRNHHFILLVLRASKSWESCGPWNYSNAPPWEDGSDLFPGGSMFSTPKEPALHLLPESRRYQVDIKRWNRASSKIFRKLEYRGTQDEKTMVALSKINVLMSHIMLAGSFFKREIEYDVFFPEFHTIITLIKYVYPHLTSPLLPGTAYKIDIGIIPALYLVSCRCRNKSIRDEAIELLQAKHYREGIWDTTAALAHALWTREMEEEGMDSSGYIPEHARAFVTSAYVDLRGRRSVLGSTQRGLHGLVFREKFVSF